MKHMRHALGWWMALAVALPVMFSPASASTRDCGVHPSSYQPHHTRNVNSLCRKYGARGFGTVVGCTVFNRPDGKFAYDKPLVILPPKGSFLYAHILRHELCKHVKTGTGAH